MRNLSVTELKELRDACDKALQAKKDIAEREAANFQIWGDEPYVVAEYQALNRIDWIVNNPLKD